MAVRDHRQTVAQNGDVDAGHLSPLRGGVVWDRHADHLLPGLFRLADFGNGALVTLSVSFLRLRLGVAWLGRGFSGRLRYGHHTPLAAIARTLIYVSYITDIRFCRSSQSCRSYSKRACEQPTRSSRLSSSRS